MAEKALNKAEPAPIPDIEPESRVQEPKPAESDLVSEFKKKSEQELIAVDQVLTDADLDS